MEKWNIEKMLWSLLRKKASNGGFKAKNLEIADMETERGKNWKSSSRSEQKICSYLWCRLEGRERRKRVSDARKRGKARR